jgi:transcriptional regulator with XRE-family HTH domain
MSGDSPAVICLKLARRLREVRTAAGLTAGEVARELLVSTSAISRLETGAQAPTARDTRDLCRFYGVSEAETAEFMAATMAARKPDPWVPGRVTGRGGLYVSLEQSAASVTCFAQDAFPALLRTADYGQAFGRPFPQLREARQAMLEMTPMWFLLEEALLHRSPGAAVMAAQLEHVLELAEAGATVQVIPFTASPASCAVANFTLLDFAGELPPMAFSEREDRYQDRTEELGYFQRQVDDLRDTALDLTGSREMIEKMRQSYLGA